MSRGAHLLAFAARLPGTAAGGEPGCGCGDAGLCSPRPCPGREASGATASRDGAGCRQRYLRRHPAVAGHGQCACGEPPHSPSTDSHDFLAWMQVPASHGATTVAPALRGHARARASHRRSPRRPDRHPVLAGVGLRTVVRGLAGTDRTLESEVCGERGACGSPMRSARPPPSARTWTRRAP